MNAGTETKGIDLFFIATGFSNEQMIHSCRFIKQIASIDLEGKFKMTHKTTTTRGGNGPWL